VGHVTHTEEVRNASTVFVINKRKRLYRRHRQRCEFKVKMYL